MYARTVTFDLNTDMWEEALAFGAFVTDQVAGFRVFGPGSSSVIEKWAKGTSFAVF